MKKEDIFKKLRSSGLRPTKQRVEIAKFLFVYSTRDGPGWAPRWSQDGPKMVPRWPQDAPKTAQDGARMAQVSRKMGHDGSRTPQDANTLYFTKVFGSSKGSRIIPSRQQSGEPDPLGRVGRG